MWVAMKPSGIGGQAVIEGVMMKNKNEYAVAVRKPNNEIVIEQNTYVSKSEKMKLFKLPIFRGMLAFVESMILGSKILSFSASFYEEEEEVKPSKMEEAFSKVFKGKAESVAMAITFMLSIILAVGIFIVLPGVIASLLGRNVDSHVILAIIEGCIRIAIFVTYIFAISQIKDIKRMFMYHGAEHKTINCIEQGFELTVENVRWQSKQHKRCGTSFMFIVMFVSIIFFIFIRVDHSLLRYLIRILLVPIIAGVSYEFIRFAGRNDSKLVRILSKPGMWLQGLTTKEPDDSMIEVAISSVEAVFDWREFLESNNKKENNQRNSNNNRKRNNKNNKPGKEDKSNHEVEPHPEYIAKEETMEQELVTLKRHKSMKDKAKKTDDKVIEIPIAREELAATNVKSIDTTPIEIFGEEEDEILRALDRYLVGKEESDK
jgi:uncharacterized protein YqhQ